MSNAVARDDLHLLTGDTWEKVSRALRDEMDNQLFDAYVKPLRFVSFDNDSGDFILSAPSKFVITQIERNFLSKINGLVSQFLGIENIATRFVVERPSSESVTDESTQVVVKKVRKVAQAPAPVLAPVQSNLNARYTFNTFVVGNSNQFCHAAAMRVAEEPGRSYNPLFIYGGVGLGKTHLLHAIGNAVLEKNPLARVHYMSSETFTNELILALRHAKMEEFKTRFRSIELLLIDDIQFMCGKERTQEEFFHTFNALYNAKHQIVITSDKIPQDIPGIEERLKTRFAWGLTADLQAPDFETRVAILNKKANSENFILPSDVAHYIAEHISSNVRELEGALTRLHAMSTIQGASISLQLVEAALKPLLQPKVVNITVNDIKRVIAERFNIKVSDLSSKRRSRNFSWPRHVAMYLCRKHTTCSYPEIGSEFGGRDHSSVIHAANVVAEKVKNDVIVRDVVDAIDRTLRGA